MKKLNDRTDAMPCVSTQKTKPQLAGWQGKRREQVEFAATLAMASIGALFVIVIALFLLQHFN